MLHPTPPGSTLSFKTRQPNDPSNPDLNDFGGCLPEAGRLDGHAVASRGEGGVRAVPALGDERHGPGRRPGARPSSSRGQGAEGALLLLLSLREEIDRPRAL